MKRRVFSIIVVSLTAAILWATFARAQETGKAGQSKPDGSQRVASSRGLENLPPEEKRRILNEMEGKFGPGRGAFVGVAPLEPVWRGPGRQTSERALVEEHERTIAELKEIRQLAIKEKAPETAARIETLITKHKNAFEGIILGMRLRRQGFELTRHGLKPSGKKAPDFKLESFDGKETSLAGLKGKIVVLEWMNFECPFSKYHYETKTTMVDMAKKYKAKGVTWLAINSTNHTKAAANTAFAKKHKLPYRILNDIPGKVGKAYGAKTTPHIFVIDRAGSIAYEGAIDNAPLGKIAKGEKYINYASQALDALLAGKPITTKQTKSYGCSVKYAR